MRRLRNELSVKHLPREIKRNMQNIFLWHADIIGLTKRFPILVGVAYAEES